MKQVFLEAIDVADEDRAAWLSKTCGGNAALRREVESLLASDRDAASFCETPAAAMPGAGGFAAGAGRLGPGSRLGHYDILERIGGGGMGEVYRARDRRDDRIVAIKTVSAALANPAGELRLLHEARHGSALTHPHICAIHELGDAGGSPFIVMEFLEGRSLDAVQNGRALPLDAALRYAAGVASALDHAHRHGVVHRDLKPSNVVIANDDRPVVLDFGLAKRLPQQDLPDSIESLTVTGHGPAGTLTHMAPEVLRGGRADARADIWALGVLLYEMVTGTLPFKGRTPFETSSAILGEAPKPAPLRLPLALRLVIGRCLEKDPAARYQSAAEVGRALASLRGSGRLPLALRLIATRPGARRRTAWAAAVIFAVAAAGMAGSRSLEPAITAIAIAPFHHGPSPEEQAYATELSEGIAAQLRASAHVRVLSSALLASSGGSVADAARAVRADAVVEGALRRSSGRLELDLRLVDTGSGATRWSQRFARESREVLVLQAEAVRALAAKVDAALTPAARERLRLVPAIDPAMYEEYLKGRYEWNQRTAGSLERAAAHFERAIALDPAFAPAYARLADCYNQLGTVMVGSGSPAAYRPRARAAAIKALQIDPDSAEAHAALGYVHHYSWEWADAERAFLRSIALDAAAPLPRLWYANMLMSKGRFDEALRQAHAARDLDPFSLVVHTNIGWILTNARRIDEAIEALRHAVSLDPAYPQAQWRLVNALAYAGRHDEALPGLERVLTLTNRSPSSLIFRAHMLALAGRGEEARRGLAEAADLARRTYVSPGMMPGPHVALGDRAAAIDWMERAHREGANAVAYFAVEPWTYPLHGEPRYQDLLRRVGLDGVPQR